MATITFHLGLGPYGSVSTQYDWANLFVTWGDGSLYVMEDPDGMRVVMSGVGLTYAGDALHGGTVTGFQVLDATDAVLFEVTDAAASAPWLYDWILAGNDLNYDLNGGPGRLWGADNIIFGSTDDDYFLTGAGNDVTYGGDGRDLIHSQGGDDTMTGGRGRDHFALSGAGDVVLTDFNDLGNRRQEDEIFMDHWAYRHMQVDQVGSATVMTITGRGGAPDQTVTLWFFDAANLDRSDFTLGF